MNTISGNFTLRAAAAFLSIIALGAGFWSSTSQAEETPKPLAMIETYLTPIGKTVANATKEQLLDAVCQAVKRWKASAPQIVRAAAEARPELKKDILETAYRCLGSDDCNLLDEILDALTNLFPKEAAALTGWAADFAPGCTDAFGATADDGRFGQTPGNQNPPPGSIGGGGGGSTNLVAVCRNGETVFVTPDKAEEILRDDPGATLGPCQVTPVTNP